MMNRMNRIFFGLSALLVSFFMTSCTEEMTAELGDPDNKDCYGIYFPSQKGTGDLQIGPDDPKSLTFKVRRTNTRGRLTVPVTLESEHQGIFSATEIVFEEDAPTAEVEIFFPTVKQGVRYDCTLKVVGDEYVSSYSQNATHLSFSVTCVKWNRLVGENGETTGLWRDGVFPEWFSVARPNLEQSVVIEERDDMPGYYRIFDVYNSTYMTNMFQMNASSICLEQHYTYIDATDPEKVWIPTFKTGIVMSADYGEMSIASYVVENEEFDPSISSIYGTMKDGVITFPANALQLHLAVLGWYPTNSYGLHRIILPGCRAIDDSISISAGITGTDGKVPVEVNFGVDVKKVKIYVEEGELSESVLAGLAEEIASGLVQPTHGELVNSSTIRLAFDKTATYTILAVGLGQDGKLIRYAFETFGFKADPSEKAVELNYGLICSNKYAPDGMTEENSLELYINGKDIKRLHVGLYEKDSFEKDEEAYWNALSQSQLNEANLALVNGSGLSLVQSGLVPGTEYVLAMRAYNGYSEEDFVVSEMTGGAWDYRMAFYSSEDIDAEKMMNIVSPSAYYGTYNYYAMEGTSSRYCLGEVVISESSTTHQGQPCVKVSGLFPFLRKTYGVEDDSIDFYYYNGYILNYDLRLEYFIFEGMYVYTEAMLYASNGSAYGGQGGILAAFVEKKDKAGSKPCIAMMDSGMAADLGVTFNGFALLGFEDSNHSVSLGLLDLVESMVLVPKENDPNPLLPPSADVEEEIETAGVKMLYNMAQQGHRMNLVETSEGLMMSLIDRLENETVVTNHFDLGSAMIL